LWIGQALPATPPYAAPEQITAFLTAHDKFFITLSLPITVGDFAQIHTGIATLYLLGYIEYQDRFKQRHRHGYARRYDAGSPENNLVFVTQTDYNYDKPL
jgi:hypothetical protein